MKKYQNFDTGEIFTESEIYDLYKSVESEVPEKSFEEHMEKLLNDGIQKIGGLIEIQE